MQQRHGDLHQLSTQSRSPTSSVEHSARAQNCSQPHVRCIECDINTTVCACCHSACRGSHIESKSSLYFASTSLMGPLQRNRGWRMRRRLRAWRRFPLDKLSSFAFSACESLCHDSCRSRSRVLKSARAGVHRSAHSRLPRVARSYPHRVALPRLLTRAGRRPTGAGVLRLERFLLGATRRSSMRFVMVTGVARPQSNYLCNTSEQERVSTPWLTGTLFSNSLAEYWEHASQSHAVCIMFY